MKNNKNNIIIINKYFDMSSLRVRFMYTSIFVINVLDSGMSQTEIRAG